MFEVFATLLFLMAFTASVATIIHMVRGYWGRAVDALRMEHVPQTTGEISWH